MEEQRRYRVTADAQLRAEPKRAARVLATLPAGTIVTRAGKKERRWTPVAHAGLIGWVSERALEKMCKRASERVAFGRPVADQGVTRERIAEARIMIDSARFMVLNAAWKMDTVGNKVARKEIAMIKVLAPNMACQIIDWAMQVHGGGGVSDDFGLANMYAHARTLRFADGPDEVHHMVVGRAEVARHQPTS